MKKQGWPSQTVVRRGEFVARVLGQRKLGSEHWSMSLELTDRGGRSFAQAKAGQFVQLACRDLGVPRSAMPLLRRPFSIAGISSGDNQPAQTAGTAEASTGATTLVEIIYRVLGIGTQWLEQRKAGASVNLLGPLGQGFTLPGELQSKVLLLGGGVGVPPMFFLADQLAQGGYKEIVGFVAARTRDLLACSIDEEKYQANNALQPQMVVAEFARSDTAAIVATDDGSFGFHGNVVEAVERFLDQQNDREQVVLYACGPPVMLKATAALAERRKLACQVCMEAYMACGMGVCQSCVVGVRAGSARSGGTSVADRQQYKLVCSNGPVFDSRAIIWD